MREINPQEISIGERQRKTAGQLDETFIASVVKRLIHPITLRHDPNGGPPILVAGGRRLAALKVANITPLIEGTHFRFLEDLDPLEAEIIELEENVKREDLAWRDHVRAIGRLAEILRARGKSISEIHSELNISSVYFHKLLIVFKNLNSPTITEAQNVDQAYSRLQLAAERKIASIVSDIQNTGKQIFEQPEEKIYEPILGSLGHLGNPADNNIDLDAQDADKNNETRESESGLGKICPNNEGRSGGILKGAEDPIICADFLSWAPTYSGPKFNLIHCDFPYGVDFADFAKGNAQTGELYDNTKDHYFHLLDCFCQHLDRFTSYQAHVVFWFHMNFYEETRKALADAGLFVHRRPLIWGKTDNSGIVPGRDAQYPRWIYETAFLASRGKRPLIKAKGDFYGAPSVSNAIHATQKSESMLRHFFEMLIDDTTDVLDPTCGSGSALRAAEDLGARRILGLELDPGFAKTALMLTLNARKLREVSR